LERVGLIHHVVEQMGRMDIEARWRQRGWSGRDAEVIQYFLHNLRRGDQGQQDHLGLASGATEPGDTEASHQQARPRQPPWSDRGRVRPRVVHGAGLIGGVPVSCRSAVDGVQRSAGLSQGYVDLQSGLRLELELGVGAAAGRAGVGVIVSGDVGSSLRRQGEQGAKATAICEHTVVPRQILVWGRQERREAF